jgi:hypothetical protein
VNRPARGAATIGAYIGGQTMRKLIISTAIVIAFVVAGSSGAAQRANEITLAASSPIIVFGQTTNLTGKLLLSEPAAAQVQILAVPLNDPERQAQVAFTLAADATGSFGTVVQPVVGTRYAAAYSMPDGTTLTSAPITIGVRPNVRFALLGHAGRIAKFSTFVTFGGSAAGHHVNVQKKVGNHWVTLAKMTLASNVKPTKFKLRVPYGVTPMRAVMTGVQAGKGYLAGISPTVVVKVRA